MASVARSPKSTTNEVTFTWSRKLVTSHAKPRPAIDRGTDQRSGKRLVQIRGDFEMECLRTNPQYEGVTTWYYNQDGTIDGDASGDWRLREAA